MRYMLLINSDKAAPPPSKRRWKASCAATSASPRSCRRPAKMVHGERLRPDGEASRVRLKAGQRQVTDGPFTETKEVLGGFYLIDCDSMKEAVEWAKKIPLRRRWSHRRVPDLADVTEGAS